MKQTAVEWLFQELTNYYNLMSDYKTRQEILEKAKEMEEKNLLEMLHKLDLITLTTIEEKKLFMNGFLNGLKSIKG